MTPEERLQLKAWNVFVEWMLTGQLYNPDVHNALMNLLGEVQTQFPDWQERIDKIKEDRENSPPDLGMHIRDGVGTSTKFGG